jgi:hypothetical protein
MWSEDVNEEQTEGLTLNWRESYQLFCSLDTYISSTNSPTVRPLGDFTSMVYLLKRNPLQATYHVPSCTQILHRHKVTGPQS